MQLTRRDAVTLLSSTALLGTAGCLGDSSHETEGPPGFSLTATISGPDGEQTFFDQDAVAHVGDVRQQQDSDAYGLPVSLSSEGTESASGAFRAVGAAESPGDATITMAVDGEETNTYDVAQDLADRVTTDEWDGLFLMLFEDEQTAETVKSGLEGG